jgi:uncharacterized protein YndB with AHSA1/START domain
MIDITDQINAVHRKIGDYPVAAGPGRSLLLRRAYEAPIEDLWDACTTAERISRWLAPVTGDLRPGGSFTVKGQASGTILHCDAPHLLKVTWEYGPESVTEVELRLTEHDAGGAVLELRHTSPTETVDEIVSRMGPIGPVGIGSGWDLALLALDRLLCDQDFDPAQWKDTPQAREFTVRSYHAWGAESQAVWGLSDEEITKVIEFLAQQPPSSAR